MRKTVFALLLFLVLAGSAFADQRVRGYYRDSDGDGYKETYVPPHYRTEPDGNPYNNYSTKGNTNPYTGERGYENPYQQNNQPRNNNYNSKSLYR